VASCAYLGDGEELRNDLHVGDELLVDLQRRLALLARHLEKLGCTQHNRVSETQSLYNNNNNNSHDNVYGAVIMTEVIARVHPVHLMNVD